MAGWELKCWEVREQLQGHGCSVLRNGQMGVGIPSSFPLVGVAESPWLRLGLDTCRHSFIESVWYVCGVPGPGTHRYLQCALVA